MAQLVHRLEYIAYHRLVQYKYSFTFIEEMNSEGVSFLVLHKTNFDICKLILVNRMLQGHTVVDSNNDGGPQFAEVFVVVWVGAIVVTVNSKLLGGTM